MKGHAGEARAGLWPSFAPVGCRNAIGADGKRIITPYPATAPVIRQLFDWFATGEYCLKSLAA